MKSRRHFLPSVLLLLVLGFVASAPAQPRPASASTNRHSLWKVEGAKSTVYLLGSIHFLTEDDYPLPQPIESAFTNASIVVFETDIAAMDKPETQMKMATKAQLPAGESLDQYLSASTYAALSNRVAKSGLPVAAFNTFRPFMVVATLAILELQKLGVSPENGLDKYFAERATKDGKKLVPLETVDFQMDMLTSFSKAEEEMLVKASLKDMDTVEKDFKAIVKAWKTGDGPNLEKYLNDAMREAPGPFKRLLTDRSKNWVPKIEGLLAGDKNAIVIVGAGHLVGNEGVVELLKKKGFKVTQL
jgi:uncharacterized protein YbaP (TraB family)